MSTANGKNGGDGGDGGNFGLYGLGGAGGSIKIGYVTPYDFQFQMTSSGGASGETGLPGDGAPSGKGGKGAPIIDYNDDRFNNQGSDGHTGWNGLQGKIYPGEWKDVGTPGSQSNDQLAYDQLLAHRSIEQLLMTQRMASNAYLQAKTAEQYRQAAARFIWLQRLTAAFRNRDYQPVGWAKDDSELARGIQTFANTLLSHYRCGLDFYGNAYNWAPILTLKEYQTDIQNLIELGENIEAQFNDYINEGKTETARLAALDAATQKMKAA
ncbi:MAG: hypothetical protein ACR2M4_05835 [Actinomycetota bacterium]